MGIVEILVLAIALLLLAIRVLGWPFGKRGDEAPG